MHGDYDIEDVKIKVKFIFFKRKEDGEAGICAQK